MLAAKALCLVALVSISLCAIVNPSNPNLERLREITHTFVDVVTEGPSRLLQLSTKPTLSITCNNFCPFLDCNGCECSEDSCSFCFWNNGKEICLECDDNKCTGCTENCGCVVCPKWLPRNCQTLFIEECGESVSRQSLAETREQMGKEGMVLNEDLNMSEEQQKEVITTVMESEEALENMEQQITETMMANNGNSTDQNITEENTTVGNVTEGSQNVTAAAVTVAGNNQQDNIQNLQSGTIVNETSSNQPYRASEQVRSRAIQSTNIPIKEIDPYFTKKFCDGFCDSLGGCSYCQCNNEAICLTCLEKDDFPLCMECNSLTQECYGCEGCLCYSCKSGENCDFFSNTECTPEQFNEQLQEHRETSLPGANATFMNEREALKKTHNSLVNGNYVCNVICTSQRNCHDCSCEDGECNMCFENDAGCPVCSADTLTCQYCNGCKCYECDRYDQCTETLNQIEGCI